MLHCTPMATRRVTARSRTTRSSRAIATTAESRGTSQLIVTSARQWKRMMEKVQNLWIGRVEMAMTRRNAGDSKRKNISQRIVLANKQKDQADSFFIGMSVDKEEYKFHQKTPSEQAEYKEHLRDSKLQHKQELFGGDKMIEAKRKPRECVVCGTMGPWYLVCN